MNNGTDRLKTERSALVRLPVHANAARTESFRQWVARQRRPLAIDLFSGCGGLSVGLEQAGYTVILSVDNDPWALETHRHNLPGAAINLDLSDPERVDVLLRLLDGLSIDLVAGGPPCQPFSRAGRSKLRDLVRDGVRAAKDERTELWQTFISIVERLRPAAMMLENVPDMALGDEVAIARAMTARLEKAGYDVQMRLVDSWRLGVPQHRQRFILVALRDGQKFKWPAEQEKVTLRAAIGDLPPLRGGQGKAEMPAARTFTAFQRRARAGMNGTSVVFDHVTRPVRDDDREAFRLMKPGTRYGELPKHLRRYRDDIFDDKYNRLSWDDVSRSITAHIAKDGYWYIHPSELRTLSVREAARIQTFPDHFRFAGTRSHAFRQIGNAVPVALAEAIGSEISRALRSPVAAPEKRDSRRVGRIRAALLKWAAGDARKAPWRHPGDPWKVMAGVCLGDRNGGRDEAVQVFLERFPSPTSCAEAEISRETNRQGVSQRDSLRALARAARVIVRNKHSWSNDAWAGAASLGPADEAVVRAIGLNEDRILSSTPLLRVVARLTGSRIDEERRLSDGRLAVAVILGTGKDVPALNAALHAIGRVVCTPRAPKCSQCPVVMHCLTTASKAAE
jgi:DNA (cytosine-5)-methyltransferase 1